MGFTVEAWSEVQTLPQPTSSCGIGSSVFTSQLSYLLICVLQDCFTK